MSDSRNIYARAIVEIAGSPKEFIEKTMGLLLEHIEAQEGYTVKKKKRFKAKKYDKVFSTFSELEIVFSDFYKLIQFCFETLPSSIEILEPQRLELRREDLADMINDLLLRLHKSDMVVKETRAKNKLLEDANKLLVKNAIAMALRGGAKTAEEISRATGIKQPNLDSILAFYEGRGLIKKEGNKYSLVAR